MKLRKIASELIPDIQSDIFSTYASATASIYVPDSDSTRHVSDVIAGLNGDGWSEVRRFIDTKADLNADGDADERAIVSEVLSNGTACNVRRSRRISSGPVEVTAEAFLSYKAIARVQCTVWLHRDNEPLSFAMQGETVIPILTSTTLEDTEWRPLTTGTIARRFAAKELGTLLESEVFSSERMIAIDLVPGILTTFHPASLLRD